MYLTKNNKQLNLLKYYVGLHVIQSYHNILGALFEILTVSILPKLLVYYVCFDKQLIKLVSGEAIKVQQNLCRIVEIMMIPLLVSSGNITL